MISSQEYSGIDGKYQAASRRTRAVASQPRTVPIMCTPTLLLAVVDTLYDDDGRGAGDLGELVRGRPWPRVWKKVWPRLPESFFRKNYFEV